MTKTRVVTKAEIRLRPPHTATPVAGCPPYILALATGNHTPPPAPAMRPFRGRKWHHVANRGRIAKASSQTHGNQKGVFGCHARTGQYLLGTGSRASAFLRFHQGLLGKLDTRRKLPRKRHGIGIAVEVLDVLGQPFGIHAIESEDGGLVFGI